MKTIVKIAISIVVTFAVFFLFECFKIRIAAEFGDKVAQCALAEFYFDGEGVPQDYVKAATWFHKSANQGYAEAQNNLGVCYDNGLGVQKDHLEAARWFVKAAEQGYAKAQYNLGLCYAKGEGVSKDMTEAVKWLRKAAEQGDEDAIELLKKLGESY